MDTQRPKTREIKKYDDDDDDDNGTRGIYWHKIQRNALRKRMGANTFKSFVFQYAELLKKSKKKKKK